ncbi:MAG: hypothetical protein AAF628_32735 [Planctomycetota bacterium]
MNPGRGSTRLGNDAVPVWLDVPRWLAPKMRQAFEAAGMTFTVREGYIGICRDPEQEEPTDFMDRFLFRDIADDATRGAARVRAAAIVQRVVDSVPESRRGGC